MHFLIAFVLALILVLSFGQLTNNYKVGLGRALAGQADAGRAGRA